MSETGLILAFYRDHTAADETLKRLRALGLRRTATLRRHADGKFTQNRGGLPSEAAVIFGGAVGALLGRYLPLPRTSHTALAPAIGAVAGGGAGFAASQGADGGLPEAVLRRQQRWLLRGDTVLVAQARGDVLDGIIEALRESGQPSVFVLRGGEQFRHATEAALRSEIVSSDQLRETARKLSKRHRDAALPRSSNSLSHRRLIERLKDNERVIAASTESLVQAARLGLPVSIAAEWLLDNGYIVEGQIKDALQNLSRQFYAHLPVLPAQIAADQARIGHLPAHDVPRVYALAVELVAAADSRLDKGNISDFIREYQAVTPLTMGELWALPLMLRVAIVENLRRLAGGVARRQHDREQASLWANRLLNAAHHDTEKLPRLFADLAHAHPQPGAHFADRLIGNLFDEESALLPARSWLENALRTSLDEALRNDQRRQATDQVSVANCVTSLRHLGTLDWRSVFESLSVVESELRGDPSGIYAEMDFATRDQYRHEIEKLSRGAKLDEIEVARRVVALSGKADFDAPGEMRRHIGHFLLGPARLEFERALQFQPQTALRAYRFVQENATPLYLSSIALGTGSVLAVGGQFARRIGTPLSPTLVLLGMLPASEVAVQIVNYIVTRTLPTKALPKMNFEHGVPDEWRTIVVVPTMLSSPQSIADDLQQLEIHYLANIESNLRFALLADYVDAPDAHLPNDAELLDAARLGIDELNERYRADSGGDRFFLFHRSRVWSDTEDRWMGRERKRGKLEELNRYLKGAHEGHPEELHPVTGDETRLQGIRFVITLDADTQMPHDTARHLIETLSHPLNRPVVQGSNFEMQSADDDSALAASPTDIVQAGYTIIQPRVSTTLPSATATRFARWFSDNLGLDPYTNVVSDVYQDLFGEGSYHGKGIYDLDAFHAVLDNRFPPCTLLSHDLIEGAHVRVAYASDIELLDDFPSNYLAESKRQHRWIRGDWQILDWILGSVPSAMGTSRVANPLSILNRWKVADNLRRSLFPIGTTAFLVTGWLAGPNAAKAVTTLVVGNLFWPVIGQIVGWLTSDFTNPAKVKQLRQEAKTLIPTLVRSTISTALLPHHASVSLDAIARVLYRKYHSRKLLLEWETARIAGQSSAQREQQFLWRLGGGALFAAGVAYAVRIANPAGFVFAAPFLVPWAAMPALVKWLSGRWTSPPQEVQDEDRLYLRRIARQTWRYFDDFIGPHTNWLAPDNYQERLRVEIAQRTSPTNIGMWLLAVEAARDFGYVTGDDAIGRLLETMKSLDELEKYRGHLFNWYQVQTMEPLPPRYVSVVDSGNLLGSLWTLSEGIRELTETPVLTGAALRGLGDTMQLLNLALSDQKITAQLSENLATLNSLVDGEHEHGPVEIMHCLRAMSEPLSRLSATIHARPQIPRTALRLSADLASPTSDPRFTSEKAAYWAAQIEGQLEAWLHLMGRYLTWLDMLATAPDAWLWPLGEDASALRRELLQTAPSLTQLSAGKVDALTELLERRQRIEELPAETTQWLEQIEKEFNRSRWLAGEMLADAVELVDRVEHMADEMDFRFLYDAERKLFPIGFNVEESRLDTSYYDLVASECRLTSFMAVARGDVPVEHWMTLGRRFGLAPDGTPVLLSWSGTMFEYLMPLIFTPNYENSLLDWACKQAVRQQMLYGKARNVPWGISEAAFSALDVHRIYQYKAFGVPALGLKRGLENDLVVAPYSTMMALMVEPRAAVENLRRLEAMGMVGDYGFYESIDFKHQQLGDEDNGAAPTGRRGVVVHSYMVHHQGMALLSLDNYLNGYPLRQRFSAQPFARAGLPLLYEKIPVAPPVLDESVREAPAKPVTSIVSPASTERLGSANTTSPRVNLLSNGRMSVLTTNAGGGYSRWENFDLTRWRADTTRDQWGSFIYVRDVESTSTWSAAHQPVKRAAKWAHVFFRPEKTEYSRRDHDIETHLQVFISPEDNAEIRLLCLTNHSNHPRVLEVSSFMELALAPHNADRAHPAFSKLFIQTEALPEIGALLAWRRLRSPHDTPIWAGHVLSTNAISTEISYETDRAKFLGRNRTSESPQAIEGALTNTAGAVLDPCFSLRQRIVLAPGQRVDLAFTLVAGSSRDEVLALVEKYADPPVAERALDLAWTHAQLEMHHLNIDPDLVQQFQHLASYMAYPFDALRAPARRLRQNQKGQSGLWAYGVSGDLPILLVTIGDQRDVPVARQAMQAHAFWRARGFKTDLLILNEQASGYNQELSDTLRKAALSFYPHLPQDQIFDVPGGIFIRPADQMPEEDLSLLLATARVVLVAARGPIAQQLGAVPAVAAQPPRFTHRNVPEQPSAPLPFMELPYFNSLGGFTTDGREYAIFLGGRDQTPAPWINVIAGPLFGTIVSESGRGFTWYGNSQSNRLTPWSNDPVSEGATEAIYIRDEDSGVFWTPTPLPIRENDPFRARHGQGYSVFEHNSHAIEQELTVFVPLEGEVAEHSPPVRIARLRLKNASSKPRKLRVTHYADWVLGTTREEMQMHLVTAWDTAESILLAYNHYRPDFSHRVAFSSSSPRALSFSSDRTAFLGRNGSPSRPAAMERRHLDERCGAGFDSCGAVQVLVELEPGETSDVIFLLGEANDVEEARDLVRRFRDPARVEAALDKTKRWWDDFLGVLQVDVPDPAVNFLLNRWLPYQVLSCRVWGRSAWYQSGGAFGFRDQLQDVMALLISKPQLAREHILRAAAHQFEEGDVQHWWHPPGDAGVRTRFADDLLWLPYVTAQYVEVTGDHSVLDEIVPFLKGEPLADDEHEVYNQPQISQESASIFEHCRRTIEKGCTYGPHELPLIGTGDWNDGLNRVGVEGKGESVWMAWFLYDVLHRFARLCDERGEKDMADDYRERAAHYAAAVEEHAWDGDWYLRAFFDDGSPMGSHKCVEAKIDSLPQSWAVISGGGDEERIPQALKSAEKWLVEPENEMIKLFTPAFDQTEQDPGYIKGYLPGVRENGGQYTHAAIWMALAFAQRGEGNKAYELLRMLNPVEHARTPEETWRYKVEPYVVVADVYALEGHVGRGGWTWYTGSASWLYRAWIEGVLGFHLRGDKLEIDPVIPDNWREFKMTYRRGSAVYEIHIENPDGVNRGVAWIEVDGERLPDKLIPLADDGQTHEVLVRMGDGASLNGRVIEALPAVAE